MSDTTNIRNKLYQVLGKILNSPHVHKAGYSFTFEESAEDIRVANIPEKRLERIFNINANNITPRIMAKAYFIDGTLRTVHICNIRCQDIEVPVFLSQIVVGAVLRENRRLKPFRILNKFVILAPSRALSEINCYGIYLPSDITLDHTGNFYEKILKNDVLFSDISLKLQSSSGLPSLSIEPEELVGTGKLRSRARDRARVIMRIMELLLAYGISRQDKEAFIIMDGPIGLLLPYSRLTGVIDLHVEFPSNKYTQQAQRNLYEFLNKVIGIVKNVMYIPTDLIQQEGISFYSFPQVSGLADPEKEDIDIDDLRSYIIAGYMRLRPKLLREIPSIWSSASALIRIDIPLPAILDPSLSDNWLSFFKQQADQTNLPLTQIISNYINSTHYSIQRLTEIVSYIAGEAYPIPSASPHRMLVELYPIAETEHWLKSKLLAPEELSSLL